MKIAVFCGATTPHNPQFALAARQLGELIASNGHSLLYGGSNLGLMGVVSGAALEEGGRVVGVIPNLFSDDIIHSQRVTELVRVRSMAERKERIMEMCDAFIALPGGIGTIDEVSEVMVANQLQIVDGQRILDGSYKTKPMILLNIDGYYNPILDQLRLTKEEGLMRSYAGLSAVADVNDICNSLERALPRIDP
jgi:uncharacterized protein (TIGR00730 family)